MKPIKQGLNFHFYIFGFYFGNFATFQNLFCVFCGLSHGGGIFFIPMCACYRGYITPHIT